MHIRKTASLLPIALAAVLYGCDSNDNTPADTSTTMPAPGENPIDPITIDGLAGTWNLSCTASAISAEYLSAVMNIADDVATMTETFFTDSACTAAASPAVIVTDNSLVFDGTTTSDTLGEANNVAWTVESKTVDGTSATDGINAVTYDIMLVTNNTLYFGNKADANNGTTEALRPQTLDETITWSNL